ncbi:TetR family transcriptional regulator [Rhodococcus sp. KBS0724]|uniref:TetR/AcrR family transcriptional regulator n=1 Tax=Rhodococcus sp. KBS0724 TaxID=1179674 RepID=UPI00110E3CF0|nr:TetR/AcrR family transcriptional regulator [Rhodococcus sp. KBS0724]TSD47254.1 TetR family transcriptional regulator [Rhodococcus sp. KBS0724]
MTTRNSVNIPAAKRAPDLRERRRQETRLEISRAALELFELHGSSATTVDEIARRAGVSPSTFFRCFATKEDSALSVEVEFETEIVEWLDAIAADELTLTGIQAIYGNIIERLETSPDRRDRILRVRRLLASDPHLCASSFAAESMALIKLTDRVAAKLGGEAARPYARLLVESAAMTTRIAVDTWAERLDNGADADLAQIYRNTCEDLRRAAAG